MLNRQNTVFSAYLLSVVWLIQATNTVLCVGGAVDLDPQLRLLPLIFAGASDLQMESVLGL